MSAPVRNDMTTHDVIAIGSVTMRNVRTTVRRMIPFAFELKICVLSS